MLTPICTVSYIGSDAASGREMSDGYEGIPGGKPDGKPSKKHHRRSSRTRSRQEKTNKPKLTILNVSPSSFLGINTCIQMELHRDVTSPFPAGVQHWRQDGRMPAGNTQPQNGYFQI